MAAGGASGVGKANAGLVPGWDTGAIVLVGEAHDELARVEREGTGGVEVLAAVVGREAHSEVGRAVEADQLRHDGPVHGPRAHLRRDLDLRTQGKRPQLLISIALERRRWVNEWRERARLHRTG